MAYTLTMDLDNERDIGYRVAIGDEFTIEPLHWCGQNQSLKYHLTTEEAVQLANQLLNWAHRKLGHTLEGEGVA